ncbi:MAG: sigma-70 family RNA polymerase sigma factor [Planctomycetes bacterium]|nr:sigma-70 family RNA polymerase sigma factor [Planctomycetota bacterium]
MTDDYTDDPGVQLMLAWQAGDEGAFEELVERYSGMVFALLTRFLGRRPGREDMVQDVFLRVVGARERYQPTARFSTYLYRIVFNMSVNETQRHTGKRQVSLDAPFGDDDGGNLLELQDGDVPDPSSGMERDDVVHAVRAAIAALPDKQRAALILAKYHDTPYAEIGEILGSSEKAIKSLIHRARETLRETLAPFLIETEGDVL